MLSPQHQLPGGEEREDIEPISVCSHHTPATGGEEREAHRANQVYALTHTPATGGRGERVIETIQLYCAHHTHS